MPTRATRRPPKTLCPRYSSSWTATSCIGLALRSPPAYMRRRAQPLSLLSCVHLGTRGNCTAVPGTLSEGLAVPTGR